VTGEIWTWRGPAPYHFVTVDEDAAEALAAIAPQVSYGWGMIPVSAAVGTTTFTTSLWPKDGTYVIPLKDAVRLAQRLEVGDIVTIDLRVGTPPARKPRRR